MNWTNDKDVDAVVAWLADYRMEEFDPAWSVGVLEGLEIGAALAMRHPEYLHALIRKSCAAHDAELDDLPDGHSWAEVQDVADLLVEEMPLQAEASA